MAPISTAVLALLLVSRPAPGAEQAEPDDEVQAAVSAPRVLLPPEVVEAALRARHQPLSSRMTAVSEPMLGAPYVIDPLGEGEGVDPDPPARYDVFDCLTFVEEVMAVALAGDPEHAAWIRHALRYGDAPATYANRRHFMELQWVAGNVRDGWLVETTARYGETVRFEREITPETWEAWSGRARFALDDEQLPHGLMTLDVLPLEAAIEAIPDYAPGSVIMIVREDRADQPLWITHLGFLTDAPTPTFRHAARGISMRVRDHDLGVYLRQWRTLPGWPVVGVAVFEPVEILPRISALPPDEVAAGAEP